MASLIGSTVKITASDGEYIGVLTSIDENNGRLTISSVTCVDSGQKLHGIYHFYKKEIFNVVVVEEKKPSKSIVTDEKKGRGIISQKLSPGHVRNLKDINRKKLLLPQGSSADETERNKSECTVDNGKTSTGSRDCYTPEIPFTVVDCLDEKFNQAVDHIQQESVIAVSAEGVELGRCGQLCWLAVATRTENILFDIVKLGAKSFSNGLAHILQSDTIQKVIHDCRRLSDMFFHNYAIKLENIFDTQVAEVTVFHTKNGCYQEHVPSLAKLLIEHLKLHPDLVHNAKIRVATKKEDEMVWSQRPALPELLVAATKNVMYLLRLRDVLMCRLLNLFTSGVNLYLRSIRDVQDISEHRSKMCNQHHLPQEFRKLCGKSAVNYIDPINMDQNGFYSNFVGTSDPGVKYNHSSLWRKGDGLIVNHDTDRDLRRARCRKRSQVETVSRSRSHSRGRMCVSEDDVGESVLSSGNTARITDQSQQVIKDTPIPTFTDSPDASNSSEKFYLSDDDRRITRKREISFIASGNESRTCLPKQHQRVVESGRVSPSDCKSVNKDSGGEFDCIPAQDSGGLQRPTLSNRLPRFVTNNQSHIQTNLTSSQMPVSGDMLQSAAPVSVIQSPEAQSSVHCHRISPERLAQHLRSCDLSPSGGSPGVGRGRSDILREILTRSSPSREISRSPGGLQDYSPGGSQDKPWLDSQSPQGVVSIENIQTKASPQGSHNVDRVDAQGNITLGRGHRKQIID